MAKGLIVKRDKLEFHRWGIGEIPYPCLTKSFEINIDEIELIVISPRLALDDEILIVTLINKEGKFHQFSDFDLHKEPVTKMFAQHFDLKNIPLERSKFSWEDHLNYSTDKIIYPKELYWEDLFIVPKKMKQKIISTLKFLSMKKSIGGTFNPKVTAYLNS